MNTMHTTLIGRTCSILILGGAIKGTIVSEAFLKPVNVSEQECAEANIKNNGDRGVNPNAVQYGPDGPTFGFQSPGFKSPGFAPGIPFHHMYYPAPQELNLHFLVLTEKGQIKTVQIDHIEVDMPE